MVVGEDVGIGRLEIRVYGVVVRSAESISVGAAGKSGRGWRRKLVVVGEDVRNRML